jgi:hypothetical protein
MGGRRRFSFFMSEWSSRLCRLAFGFSGGQTERSLRVADFIQPA